MLMIRTSEDGISIKEVTESEVLCDLNEGELRIEQFKTRIPSEHDPNYWGTGIWLLKDDSIIVPKAVQKITEYTLY